MHEADVAGVMVETGLSWSRCLWVSTALRRSRVAPRSVGPLTPSATKHNTRRLAVARRCELFATGLRDRAAPRRDPQRSLGLGRITRVEHWSARINAVLALPRRMRCALPAPAPGGSHLPRPRSKFPWPCRAEWGLERGWHVGCHGSTCSPSWSPRRRSRARLRRVRPQDAGGSPCVRVSVRRARFGPSGERRHARCVSRVRDCLQHRHCERVGKVTMVLSGASLPRTLSLPMGCHVTTP